MTSQVRTQTVFAILVGAALGSGCGTAPPKAPVAAPTVVAQIAASAPAPALPVPTGLAFAPPAVAQGALVGSIVTVAPKRLINDLDALSRRLNLPVMLGQQLLASLGAEGIGGKDVRISDLVERIDPQSALAIVWTMPLDQKDPKTKGFCAALTLKDADAAKRTAEEMGAAGSQQNGVIERRTVDGSALFTAIKGRTLFVSGSAEALLFAGGLAEAAQVPPTKGQLVLTALPQALAKASGKSPEAIISEFTAEATKELAKGSTKGTKDTKGAERMSVPLVELATRVALDSSAVRVMIEAGPNDGLLIQAEVVPAAGTGLAAQVARRAPYAFDARLPVRSDGTSVMAIGDMAMWVSAFEKLLAATGPAGQSTAKATKAMLEATTEWSCVIDPAQVGIASLCSATLKQGVTNKSALDAIVAVMASQNAWEAELEGRKAKPLKIKRAADMVEIEKKIENKEPFARAMAKALAGGETVRYALTIKNGRLLQAGGANPKEVLARYGAGASAQDAPLVTAALARTKGDEGMASVDVISLVLRLLGQGKGQLPGAEMAGMVSAMPGVAGLKAPFRFALRSGNSLVGEFHIPLASLDSIAKVVRGMMGAMPQ